MSDRLELSNVTLLDGQTYNFKDNVARLGKASVIIDSASGDIASFDDGADGMPLKALNVAVEPVQDLHGYDSPWPAGGGKNKFDVDKMENTSAITISNGVITVTGNSKNSEKKLGELADLTVGETYTLTATTDGSDNIIYLYGTDANVTWSFGSSLTITQAHLDALVFFYGGVSGGVDQTSHITNFMIRLASVPDATFAPYSNICPISGRTSATVTRTGANVWDEEWEIGDISSGTGENVSGNTTIRTKNYIPVKPGATYYCVCPGTNTLRTRWYGKDKNYLGYEPVISYNGIFTVPSDAYYLRFTPQAVYGTTYNHDISINYPATDHDYHPYTGNIYTIQLGDTVYGGTLDVTGGKMVVDRAIVDLGTLTWLLNSQGFMQSSGIQTIVKPPATSSALANIICSVFQSVTAFSIYNGGNGIGIHSNSEIRVRFDNMPTDATAFKTAVSGVQLCYELATPIEITLTAQEIYTLLGTNNIWSDAGPVDVDYSVDTKLYIDAQNENTRKLIAGIEAGMTATKDYSAGDMLIVGDTLFKATTSIANGATLTPGTNVTETTLASELNAMDARIADNEQTGSDLKSAFDIFDIKRGWEKGSYNITTGEKASQSTYIRTNGKFGVCSGVKFVKCNDSYRFIVYAFDFDGNYIGGYKTDGTFNKTVEDIALNTKFACADYPQYVFAFSMRREPASSDITTEEHTNLIFSGISKGGSQWLGKFAIFYGTSLTARADNYWSFAARKIGLVAIGKGSSGQGIGNFGALSTGQVYDAICNTTDGKTSADLIVLETGANDINENVPLGTIYDTGRTTSLAGCLNDCIRYLQQNTNAMIVVMPSTASTTEPNVTDKVWEWKRMIKEICFINCVPCIECDNNLGYGKLTSAVGSDYVVDAIHPTALGARQSGETFYLKLCNVPNMLTS